MKFDCGLTDEEYRAEIRKWHRWFAWHPVRVGHRDCRWMETVERRAYFDNWLELCWEYRAVQQGEGE